ncbi:hypothetical protein L2K70_10265 [Nocardioides KLBMP 9356]|uniref:Orn/DAP/Arg decarboxylase 2 N-terminal domain-containing protein n=1 Tax=Nocardioides potassii TaxID=2911371 RepID=A0ABS9HCQ0_9ACTN|nr:hypothetical protein [Nocardioides potassii]MCF6377989.1 hypothetical protein [Nocardioides potassii]
MVLPPWREVDLNTGRQSLLDLVTERQGLLISGLDLEASVLSVLASPSILVPPVDALNRVSKGSAGQAAELLELQYPVTMAVASLADAFDFCETHGWRAWAKGERYEAVPVTHPGALAHALDRITKTWGGTPLLQADVAGAEESICFAAHDGRLLGACAMRKTSMTPEGKTWSGRVTELSEADEKSLRTFVAETRWTGGGELELVREARTDERFLIDLNPRFPAWVHGATLAGFNLPARLVAAASGSTAPTESSSGNPEFVRVVLELPAVHSYPVQGFGMPSQLAAGLKGHPSGMPDLSRAVSGERPPARSSTVASHHPAVDELQTLAMADLMTPVRLALPRVVEQRLAQLNNLRLQIAASSGLPVTCAYSIKTDPSPDILSAMHASGLKAEAISMAEVQRALGAGFTPSDIVLNGPGKWWPRPVDSRLALRALFADSTSDLKRCLRVSADGDLQPNLVGLRVAAPKVTSRFGIRLHDRRQFASTASLLAASHLESFGAHMHVAASAIGFTEWLANARFAIDLAAMLADTVGIPVKAFDFGGGWPAAMTRFDTPALRETWTEAAGYARSKLPDLEEVLFEPGKALVQPAQLLLTRVLELRDSPDDDLAAVVDASVADLADLTRVARTVVAFDDQYQTWNVLPDGDDLIYGRICMEHDILRRGVAIPDTAEPGTLLAFLDAGAYESSMAYAFGS